MDKIHLFDVIIIGTSNSFNYYDDLKKLYDNKKVKAKFLMINHLKEDIEKYNLVSEIDSYIKNIVLTPINKINSNISYILPINNLYGKNKEISFKTIKICLIGRFKDDNRNSNDLIKLINKYENLNFQIIIYTRHKKFIPDKLLKTQLNHKAKLIIHYKSSTNDIINSLNEITYFCPLSSKNSCYTKDRLTGLIPFSFNFNTPLLLDSETNNYYNLKSPIIYNESLCEIIEKICNFSEEHYKNILNDVINEKNKILHENKEILNRLFELN